jgi:hypothetical protein
MSPLVKLPYELLWLVVQYLDLEDTHALSLSCRSLQFLFHEPNIAKTILEVSCAVPHPFGPLVEADDAIAAQSKAPNTLEARQAQTSRRYAAELRRLTKRREAISTISPYLVAPVAHADSWIYENGVLCHIKERQLRILDLHRSQSTEIIIDIRRLLDEAIEASHGFTKYKFQPLYYSHGVASCLYAHRKITQSSWLVVFDVLKGRILTTHPLNSTLKIFVRNNENFLCYGVFAPTIRDGYRRWNIGCYDIGGDNWSKREVELPEFIGSDIGSTIAFEIFDDALHGVSNQTCLEAEEEDWLSFYTCFRVPFTQDGFGPIEHASRRHMWRRWHFEGPIDDRWTFLRICRDEASSKLRVVESRKEWLARSSSARRTYYTTDIVFDDGGPTRMPSANDKFLDHILLATRTKTSHPERTPAPPRNPHMVHPGDDGNEALMFTLTKSPVRCYHPSCQTFIDLVDDPPEFDPGARRIRIRGGARRRWTSGEREERSRSGAAETGESHNTLMKMAGFHNTFDEIAKIYKSEDVLLWPPEQTLTETHPALEALHEVMNPAGCFGSIRGAWDERSMVYSIEETGGLHALVFVSFDPSIYLKGAKGYHHSPKVSEASGGILGSPLLEASLPCGGKGKGKDRASGSWHPTPQPDTACSMDGSTASPKPADSVSSAPWQRVVPAMYQRMPSGFHFAL